MRVAVCLSGHLRTWKTTAKSFHRYVQFPHDADVFIHTWSTLDFPSRTWWRKDLNKIETVTRPDDLKANLSKYYNLKGFQIENQVDFYKPEFEAWNKDSQILAENVVSSLYSAKCSYHLLLKHEEETGQKYDVIVKTRPDIKFFSRLQLQSIDVDYVSGLKMFNWENYEPFSDLLNFGLSEDMGILFNFFDHIDDYLKPQNFCPKTIVPEVLMGKYLKNRGVNTSEFSMIISLQRTWRNKHQYPCLEPTSIFRFIDSIREMRIDLPLSILRFCMRLGRIFLPRSFRDWLWRHIGSRVLE